jgi:TonB-dependent SusC/RagA subfamily outer membrane receptor
MMIRRRRAFPLLLLMLSTGCFGPRIVPPAGYTLEEYKAACSHAPGAKNWFDGCPQFGPGPLFVIDGRQLPMGMNWLARRRRERALAKLDPKRIATLTVLKGAHAKAQYGDKAVRGVVVITTKRAAALVDSLPVAPACYELVPGPWQTDSLLRSIFDPKWVPRRFKLDTTRLAGWEPLQERASFVMYTVHAYPDSGQSARLFTYWARPGGQAGSVVVSYPLPLAGVRLVVQPVDSGLAGRIHSFTDALQPGKPSSASAPITARRILCPGDP